MLVVVGVDPRIHFSAPAMCVLARVHGVSVEDTGKLDFKLNGAVLVEDPVYAVLVVGSSENVRDDQLPGARYCAALVAEVSVLKKNARILFMDTDRILDGCSFSSTVDEVGVHVVDSSFAVASQAERIGHVSAAVFAEIEGMFPLVGMFWVSVGDDHFSQREAPECGALVALVVESDVRQYYALTVIEADVKLPVLPAQCPALHREGYTFWLCDIDGLEVCTEATLCFDCGGMIVVRCGFVEGSSNRGNIDVDDLLCVGVEDGAEIEGVCVLAVVDVGAVVHESLLQAHIASKALIIADCPSWVGVNMGKASLNSGTYDHNTPCACPREEYQ